MSATAITSCKVTVLNLCKWSSHALYLFQVLRNYLERYQSFRVDMTSILKITKGNNSAKRAILTIHKVTKGHKTAQKCRRSNSS